LNINVPEGTEIVKTSIFDLMGRKVYQGTFEQEIAVGDLRDGLYIISLTTAQGQVITQKFIIRQ
jgi:hypothetical protein